MEDTTENPVKLAGNEVPYESDRLIQKISQQYNDKESPVVHRLVGIVEACATDELTTDDLAQRFDVHYQTMHGNVKALVSMGLLKVARRVKGRTKYYRTSWEDVADNMKDVELRWRSGAGEFSPISTYIDKFLFVGPRRLAYEVEMFGRLLVSNRVNKRMEYVGEQAYGEKHEEAIYLRMQASIEFLENMLSVMRQAIDSPILSEPLGFQMYKFPDNITVEDATQIHDEIEMYFQQEGYYDEEPEK